MPALQRFVACAGDQRDAAHSPGRCSPVLPDLGSLLGDSCLALAIPWVLRAVRPDGPRRRGRVLALRLALVVARDIVVSGLVLARRVGRARRRSGCACRLPLTIRDPRGIAALAGIVTMTPGTLGRDQPRPAPAAGPRLRRRRRGGAGRRRIRRATRAPLRAIFRDCAVMLLAVLPWVAGAFALAALRAWQLSPARRADRILALDAVVGQCTGRARARGHLADATRCSSRRRC